MTTTCMNCFEVLPIRPQLMALIAAEELVDRLWADGRTDAEYIGALFYGWMQDGSRVGWPTAFELAELTDVWYTMAVEGML